MNKHSANVLNDLGTERLRVRRLSEEYRRYFYLAGFGRHTKPISISHRAIGIFGGLQTFGLIGLFVGPVIVAGFWTVEDG
jgi:hypothetical protein